MAHLGWHYAIITRGREDARASPSRPNYSLAMFVVIAPLPCSPCCCFLVCALSIRPHGTSLGLPSFRSTSLEVCTACARHRVPRLIGPRTANMKSLEGNSSWLLGSPPFVITFIMGERPKKVVGWPSAATLRERLSALCH